MKTAEQWVEHIGQLQGSFAVSALELIRAVQRDALEEALGVALQADTLSDVRHGIRALIPAKTWREGGGAGPQQWVEQYAGPCGSTSCPATGPHEHYGGVAATEPKETP